MKWPRGKYNGQRIIGVSFKVKVDLTRWAWLPETSPLLWKWSGGLHWLCFMTWTNWEYE